MMRSFHPWKGGAYTSGGSLGVRLLILGEAHYGDPDDAASDFTQRIVRERGQELRFAFFTRVQALVENREGWIPDKERREFWEGVAFYNFVQEFPGPTARVRPTQKMWEEAVQPYFETLIELKPELVIILGDALWNHVPYDDCATPLCGIPHPSSYSFDSVRWKQEIAQAIEAVKKKRLNS